MTGEQLAAISGAILSLLFFYVPGLKAWFGGQDGRVKALLMLALNGLIGAAVFLMVCAGVGAWVTCDAKGAYALITLVLSAAMGNQTAYLLFRKLVVPAVKGF